ncbi:hypothetical protein [Nonomuraea fuscirosea]|uniref:hypothetical protein n=1 Tax=Nonomuraea fuscirosea TaxID=1291556 RepID=UPI00342D0F13
MAKPAHLSRARLIAIVLAALLAGGFIGSRLPIGTVPLRVIEGQAFMAADEEKGFFQPDLGSRSRCCGVLSPARA